MISMQSYRSARKRPPFSVSEKIDKFVNTLFSRHHLNNGIIALGVIFFDTYKEVIAINDSPVGIADWLQLVEHLTDAAQLPDCIGIADSPGGHLIEFDGNQSMRKSSRANM